MQQHTVVEWPLLSWNIRNNRTGCVDMNNGGSSPAGVDVYLQLLLRVEHDVEWMYTELLNITGYVLSGYQRLPALSRYVRFSYSIGMKSSAIRRS